MEERRRRSGKRKKMSPIVLTVVLAVVLTAGGIFGWVWHENVYTLSLDLAGDSEITLEYGESYVEQGAESWFSGTRFHKSPEQVPVNVTGQVDEQTVGTYVLTYTASYEDHIRTARRTVHIVDTQPPAITLTQDPDAFTFPNQTYEEEGFTASDNYDGDLTGQVQRTEENGVVTYSVTDSSGNSVTVTRSIRYDDPVPPELTLNGDGYITLTEGGSYTEPGYTAADNCDGDITDRVTVSGSVDVNKPGTYTLTYTVQDSYENAVSSTRTICVKEKPKEQTQSTQTPQETLSPEKPEPNGKVIYLTFDDGPSQHTGKLLDILAKYDVKATFFVVNTSYISTVARIAQEGHTVAIHTATHVFSEVYASDEAYFNDLYKMQGIIEQYTGQTAMLIRFPGGSSNTVSKNYSEGIMTRLTQEVVDRGFRYFDWNVDSNDAGGAKTADEVFNNVVKGIGSKSTAIVLQHDTKGFSVEAVERIIIWGLNNGYTFLPLDFDSPGSHHAVYN